MCLDSHLFRRVNVMLVVPHSRPKVLGAEGRLTVWDGWASLNDVVRTKTTGLHVPPRM